MVPVAGTLPQLTVEEDGGGDLHIAVLLVDLAPVIQQGVFQGHALGQEEGEAGTLVPQHEQAQLPAQLPVVPLLSLFDPLEAVSYTHLSPDRRLRSTVSSNARL